MQVLVLNQFFWPDAAATSQLLADVVRELAAEGCAVTVICGQSAYAETSESDAPPVKIIRVRSLPFTRKAIGRVASYLTFIAAATWHGFRTGRPDAVLTLTTPPGLPAAGALIARLRGARHYIWEMDVYPDVAAAVGVLSANAWSTRVLTYLLNIPRRHADGIIAAGACMAELLADRVAPDAKIHVAENWADGAKIIPFPFPGGPLTVLYSGNLGLAHDVTTIREAMLRLRDDGRFQFAFSGGGQLRNQMQEFCSKNGLRSVSFLPYCELAALGQRLAMGHVGLVTQKNETLGCVVPSKIYGIIAAGRPVLFIGPKGATAARIVDRFRCGWNLEPGDVDGLIALLDLLAENPDLMRAAGNRGRAAFEQHYDMHAGVSRICRILRSHMEDHVFARAAGD